MANLSFYRPTRRAMQAGEFKRSTKKGAEETVLTLLAVLLVSLSVVIGWANHLDNPLPNDAQADLIVVEKSKSPAKRKGLILRAGDIGACAAVDRDH
jgi:hypothetical protein